MKYARPRILPPPFIMEWQYFEPPTAHLPLRTRIYRSGPMVLGMLPTRNLSMTYEKKYLLVNQTRTRRAVSI